MVYSVIYSLNGKAKLAAVISPVFNSYNPSEIILICWFGAKKHFL